jgi:hypothetical protein
VTIGRQELELHSGETVTLTITAVDGHIVEIRTPDSIPKIKSFCARCRNEIVQ